MRHLLDKMIKLKEVGIIILYEDKESYRNLKNKIVFVSHVKENQNLGGSSMVPGVHENLSFLQHPYCMPLALTIQDTVQRSSHQIHIPGGRVEKKTKECIIFFNILDGCTS